MEGEDSLFLSSIMWNGFVALMKREDSPPSIILDGTILLGKKNYL